MPLEDSQIQPASLDLRLGRTAYRVRASFLPGAKSEVRPKIAGLCMHTIDLRQGAVLEPVSRANREAVSYRTGPPFICC